MGRKSLPKSVEVQVLLQSRRRCSMCYGLDRDVQKKPGQIAHLDHDPSNTDLDNLAFLCFEHHDAYDSKSSQSKNYTIVEVKAYRAELYESFVRPLTSAAPTSSSSSGPAQETTAPEGAHSQEQREEEAAFSEAFRTFDGLLVPEEVARRLGLSTTASRRLMERLTAAKVLRVDRRPGTVRKWYSLRESITNRMIDAFLADSEGEVLADVRFLRGRSYELDAWVATKSGVLVVQVTFNAKRMNESLRTLELAIRDLKLRDPKRVLLFPLGSDHPPDPGQIRQLSEEAVVFRFVDLPGTSENSV